MKLRHLLFGVLAGVAFVACTNDNEPAGVTPVDGNKVAAADKYITVDLQFPGSGAATRALVDPVAATEDENNVAEAAFLFFNADGTQQVADPLVIAAGGTDANGDAWNPDTEGQTPSAKKNPVIVIKNPTAIPSSLVVLVNSGKTKDELTGKTIADLQGTNFADDYATGKTKKGTFVMSNSVYYDAAGKLVIGAPIASSNIKDTPDAAKTDPAPVKVYVERVVAKVTVKDDTQSKEVDGLTVAFKGWGLVYENGKSFLIKNLKDSYNFGEGIATNWINDPAKFRSYWADAYKPYTLVNAGTYEDLIKNSLTTPLYTQENTEFALKAFETPGESDPSNNPTAVIIAAELQKNDEGVDLYKFRGVLYEKADLITLMANNFVGTYYKKEGESLVNLNPATDFDINAVTATDIEKYEANVNLVLSEGVTNVFDATGADVTADAKEAIEGLVETVQYWNGGATYYYVPIVQNDALKVNVKDPKAETPAYWGLFGVVRNHIYQLSIKSVTGLGTAVPKTDQKIIPDIPEEEDYYIAAEINILDWKGVTQNVNLGE